MPDTFPGFPIHQNAFAAECSSYPLRGANSAVCEGPLRGGEEREKERSEEKGGKATAENSMK